MGDRYTGEHGTENFIDDYFFGPLILLVLIMWTTWLGTVSGWLAGLLLGVVLAYLLVRMEWNMRDE